MASLHYNRNYDSSLYCRSCEIGFRSIPGYLAHCNSIQHHQREAQEKETQLKSVAQAGGSTSPADKRPQSASVKPLVARREPLSAEAKPPVDSTQPTDSSKLKSKKSKSKSKAKSAQPTVHDISCCILCDVSCSGIECYTSHCAGKQHCKRYLLRQNELGFEEFRRHYGNLAYNKVDSDEPAPEVQDDYVIHAYRSGVFNKLNCRACCTRLYTYRAWYDHILSKEHGEQMIELLERHGGLSFMAMYGDLPGPNPNLFDIKDGMCNEPEMSESESGYSHPTDYHSSEVGPTGTMHDHQMSASLSQIDSWLTGHNTTHSHKSSFASSSGGYQYREHDKDLGTEYMSQRSVGLQGARKRRHESHSPDGYGQNSRLATPNFGHKDLPAELTGRADVRYASLSSHSSYSSRPVAHQMHPSLYPLGPLGYCQNVYPPMQSTAASSTLLYSYNHPAGFTDSRHPPPNYRPSQY